MRTRRTVYFAAPHQVTLNEGPIAAPGAGQVLVETRVSAISAGTELLFYRGQVPAHMPVDSTITGMSKPVTYPLAYGYSVVGDVIACGPDVPSGLLGQTVFAFQPHTSHFLALAHDVYLLPPAIDPETAVFLPNMETAVNLLMDGHPVIGERVLVLGQGVVGLLVTALLAKFPLEMLIAVDGYAQRLAAARRLGATHVHPPEHLATLDPFDPDLVFELTSNPAALATAVKLAGFGTRIVVGSWYGDKEAVLPLGGTFHRNRVQIVSSQVSTMDGAFQNRWTKSRRFAAAWAQLQSIPVRDLVTHKIPQAEAGDAYHLLDQNPDQPIQIVLTY